MAFDFLKLPKKSQRAAFANMSAASKITKATKKTTAADRLNRRLPHVESRPDGTIRKVGTRAATRSRVQQDTAETRRLQAMWARRPSQ